MNNQIIAFVGGAALVSIGSYVESSAAVLGVAIGVIGLFLAIQLEKAEAKTQREKWERLQREGDRLY